MIFVPLPPLVGRPRGPLFYPRERGVDEGLLQLQFSSGLQLLRQSTQDAFQLALPHPLLEMTMASLVRRILLGQFAPLCPRPKAHKTPLETARVSCPDDLDYRSVASAARSVRSAAASLSSRRPRVPSFCVFF